MQMHHILCLLTHVKCNNVSLAKVNNLAGKVFIRSSRSEARAME
jgi:hypothetical protein